MSSILIDNWCIEDAFKHFCTEELTTEKLSVAMYPSSSQLASWVNFLIALILWDEIWFVPDEKSFFWHQFLSSSNLDNIIHPVEYDMHPEDLGYDLNSLSTIEEERVFHYLLLCDALSISYLPHPCRNCFIEKMPFSRFDIINKVDRELNQFYNQVNEEIGRTLIQFSYPVLYDYIRFKSKYSGNKGDELDEALVLRSDPDVSSFRDSIYDIEILANSGNVGSIASSLDTIVEISKTLTSKYKAKKEMRFGSLSLRIFPSIIPSISLPFSIRLVKKSFNVTFINTLLNYGLNSRSN